MGAEASGAEGLGAVSALPESLRLQSTRDTRLIERAIAKRWDIPAEHRPSLVARQILIASGAIAKATVAEQTSAFRSLLLAEAQVQADEHHAEGAKLAVHVDAAPADAPMTEEERRVRIEAILEQAGVIDVESVGSPVGSNGRGAAGSGRAGDGASVADGVGEPGVRSGVAIPSPSAIARPKTANGRG